MQKQQQWRIRQRGSSGGGGGSVSSSSRTGRARNRGRQLAGGRLDGGSFNQDGHPRTTLFVPGQTQHNLLIYVLGKLTFSLGLAFPRHRSLPLAPWHSRSEGEPGVWHLECGAEPQYRERRNHVATERTWPPDYPQAIVCPLFTDHRFFVGLTFDPTQ